MCTHSLIPHPLAGWWERVGEVLCAGEPTSGHFSFFQRSLESFSGGRSNSRTCLEEAHMHFQQQVPFVLWQEAGGFLQKLQ